MVFVLAMKDYLPSGLKGLLLVAFLSAYMSTISTQLNWGASYLTNDLYKRFIRKSKPNESEEEVQKDYVQKARYFTFLIVIIGLISTMQMNSIDGAAKFLIECGAGLGMVLILRWYWWRINAWSEIIASIAPFIGYIIANFWLELTYPYNFLMTVLFSTISWIIATFITNPTDPKILTAFYQKVEPHGWWKDFDLDNASKQNLIPLLLCWISAVLLVYDCLFFIGDLVFQNYLNATVEACLALFLFLFLRFQMKRTRMFRYLIIFTA